VAASRLGRLASVRGLVVILIAFALVAAGSLLVELGGDCATPRRTDRPLTGPPPGLGGKSGAAGAADGEPRPSAANELPGVRSGGSLRLAVSPPLDGQYLIELQRWSPRADRWRGGHPRGSSASELTASTRSGRQAQVTGLVAGKYRVVEVYAAAVVARFDVSDDLAPSDVRVDLSQFGYATGKVVGPVGTSVSGTLLSVANAARTLSYGGVGEKCCVGAAGSFKLRVRGDSQTAVSVVHPLLRSAGGEGVIHVSGPSEGLVIRLERGPTATIRPSSPVEGTEDFCGVATVPVKLYVGEVDGKPAYDLHAVRTSEGLSFGGFAPGKYTLWVDASPFAAAVRHAVRLEAGHTDLGSLRLTAGESIRLNLASQSREESVSVTATYEGLPRHRRSYTVQLASEGGAVIRGLVPGEWSLVVKGSRPGKRARARVVVRAGETASVTVRLP